MAAYESQITSILFVDTETTGLKPEQGCRVIEVACASLDLATGEVSGEWEALIEGGQAIMGEHHRKAGTFDGADWSKALPREAAIGELFRRMRDRTIGGQNFPFDESFLRHEALLLSFGYPRVGRRLIDTVPMAMPLLLSGRCKDLKLETTRKWAGRDGKQAHRALGDVLDTIAVFKKLCEASRIGLETMEAMGG